MVVGVSGAELGEGCIDGRQVGEESAPSLAKSVRALRMAGASWLNGSALRWDAETWEDSLP